MTNSYSAKEIEWDQLKRNVWLFGHNDFSLCFFHLHPRTAPLYCSVVPCLCTPGINGKAAMETSSNLTASLVCCAMCCLRKPWKPENLWKAMVCVYRSYFRDNNFDFQLWKQQQVIAGKLSKSLKCLAVLFQWLCSRLSSVEFKAIKHNESQVPCLRI